MSIASIGGEHVVTRSLELVVVAVECDKVTITEYGAGGGANVVCAFHVSVLASASIAILLDSLTFIDGTTLEYAWAVFGCDAFASEGVEDHAGHAGAAGSTATEGWAGYVHVQACRLAVGALVPNLISWAHEVSHAVDFGTFPLAG